MDNTQTLVFKILAEVTDFTAKIKAAEGLFTNSVDRMKGAVTGLVAGLGAGLSVAAFTTIVKSSIEANASLNDLSIQTGLTVESLSALASIGKYSDVGAEQIAQFSNKLTRNLTSVTEESAGTGKAIKALGLGIEGFAAMSPEERFTAIAKSLDGFQDGAEKAAVMMALFGKEGASMLPFMKDLATVGDIQAKVTAEQAAASDNLSDNLTRLTSSGDAWKKELANGVIPTLDQAVQALLDATNGTGGLRDEVKKLSADGTLAQWTRNGIEAVTYLMDGFSGLKAVVKSAGDTIGAVAAAGAETFSGIGAAVSKVLKGDFAGAYAELVDADRRANAIWSSLGDSMADTWSEQTLGSKIRARMRELQDVGETAEKLKPKLDITGLNVRDGAAKVDPQIKAYADLLAGIREKINATGLEIETGGKLTEAQKLELDIKKQVEKGTITATQAQTEEIKVLLKLLGILDQKKETDAAHLKQIEDIAAIRKAELQTAMAETGSLLQQITAQQQATEAIGLNATAVAALDAARLRALATQKELLAADALEREGNTTLADQYRVQAELLRKLADGKQFAAAKQAMADTAKQAEEDWLRTSDQIGQGLASSLMQGGKSAWEYIKALFRTQLVMRVGGVLTSAISGGLGLSGTANAATGAAAGLNTLSGLGTLASGAGAFGSGFASGLTAWGAEGSVMGLLGSGSSLFAGGLANGLGTIAGALGPIALGVGAVYALVKSLDDSGTYHTGGLGSYSAAGGTATGNLVKTQGLVFDLASKDYTASGEQASAQIAAAVVGMLDSTAATFGQQAGHYVATAFARDTSNSAEWGAFLVKLGDQTLIDWKNGTDKWPGREFSDGEAGAKEYASAIATDLRNLLIAQTPAWADATLQALGDSVTFENLSATVTQINAAATALRAMGHASVAFSGMAEDATANLIKALGGAESATTALSSYYTDYYTEGQRTAIYTAQLTKQFAELGSTLPTGRDQLRSWVDAAIAAGNTDLAAKLIALSPAFSAISATVTDTADTLVKAQEQASTIARDTLAQLDSATSRQRTVIQQSIDGWQSLVDEVGSVATWLTSTVADLRAQALPPAAALSRGQSSLTAMLNAALSTGTLPDQADLQQTVSTIRAAIGADGMFGNATDRQYATLKLAGDLEQLGGLATDQLTTAERALRIEQQQLDNLDQTLAYWKQQVELTQGNLNATLSVADAIVALQEALKPGSTAQKQAAMSSAAQPIISTTGSSMDAYRSSLEGLPDYMSQDWVNLGGRYVNVSSQTMAAPEDYYAARLKQAYWSPEADMASTFAQLSQSNFAGNADMLLALAKAAGLDQNILDSYKTEFLPKFAAGGWHSGGWAIVGENGPELAHMPPAQIYTANQTRNMLSGGSDPALLAEMQAMRADMQAVHKELTKATGHQQTTADKLSAVIKGNALVTASAPKVITLGA